MSIRLIPAYPNRIDKSAGPDACWPWTARRQNRPGGVKGYGVVTRQYKRVLVHRLVLEEKLGRPLAPGMFALHTCDNMPCCNPAHLFEGTQRDNMRDAASKGRTANTKLTPADVREIRARYRPGQGSLANSVRLASEFGVQPATIWRAAVGRSHA